MRFQINDGGWFIGATLIPASTVLDYGDKADHELTPCETLAKGRTPPLTATALDWDSAVLLHRNTHPELHYRLRRHLSTYDEDMYQRIISGELNVP